jgi:aspartyl/asparaginyl beta-hydroxylase (cupin superfamily)
MIRVGHETRKWKEGGCLVFDTSYEHEVWNRTTSQRVVLQVSFLRPELSVAEKEWVSKAILS